MSKLYPILRLLMPPIILKMRQDRLRSRHLLGPYATVEEALSQVKKDAFKGDVWEKHTNKKLLAPKNIDKDILPQHQVVLATLVGQLSISRLPLARSLKIVDWGGGGGELFDIVTSGATSLAKLEYIVVDNTRLIQAGKRVRPTIRFVDCDDDQAVFHEIQDVDLMFISCALHYIPQWESFIQRILKQYRPGLLYIARHYSPDVLNAPAFATQRIYTGSDYAGEAVLHLLPERLLTQQLSASYHKVLSTVNSIPDYFPSTFDALNIRERNILFRRKSD